MGKKKQKVVIEAEVEETEVAERPQKKTMEDIYAASRDKREADDADSLSEDGEPVSELNLAHARIMDAESRGEEPDPADLEFGTEELEEGEGTASAEAMAREAAGEDIEEEAEDVVVEGKEKPQDKVVPLDTDYSSDTIEAKVDGNTYTVPKWEVDEAGGLEAYQKKRTATRRLRNMGNRIAQTQSDLAELVSQQTADRSSAETLPSSEGASENETSVAQLRAEATDLLWDGDPEGAKAKNAEADALMMSQGMAQVSDGDGSSPPQIELPESAKAMQREVKADQDLQMDEANALAREEFGDICNDPTLKGVLFNKFADMYRDEINSGREMKHVVREAGLWLRGQMGQSVVVGKAEDREVSKKVAAKIVRKRRTPQLSGAAGRRPAENKETGDIPLKGSDAIARMKERFGQG